MSRKILFSVIGFILILILVFLTIKVIIPSIKGTTSGEEAKKENDTDEKPKAKASPVLVEAEPSHRGPLVIRVSASGQTEAIRQITINPKLGGEIIELPVYEGKYVKSGEPLLQLNDREYQLSLSEARDELLKARGEFEIKKIDRKTLSELVDSSAVRKLNKMTEEWKKAQQQFHNGEIDEATYERIRLNYQSAQIIPGVRHEEMVASQTGFSSALINYERAKLSLSHCYIKAPFSGLIGDLKVQIGQYVSSGQECFKIVDLSRIRVNVGVLESEIQHLKVGRAATIELPAFPDEKFKGEIVTINPLVDPENKTCRVTVEINNPDFKIKSGMFAYVKLDAQIFQDRLLVPRTAILTRDQRNLVFIVRENEENRTLAKWDYVDTGLENEDYVEILKSNLGLEAGELVLTSGHYTLAHDAEVRVVDGER